MKHFATLFGGGGGGLQIKKDVFIQIQNSIVSLKALALLNCLNTFVHDSGYIQRVCGG